MVTAAPPMKVAFRYPVGLDFWTDEAINGLIGQRFPVRFFDAELSGIVTAARRVPPDESLSYVNANEPFPVRANELWIQMDIV